MKDTYLIKYLQRVSLYIGLCLLLVCSANVAFAQQDRVIGLSDPSRDGATVRFTINLPSIVYRTAQHAHAFIRIDGIDASEIINLTGPSPDIRCGRNPFGQLIRNNRIFYRICTSGVQSVELELELDPDTTIENLTIVLRNFSRAYNFRIIDVPMANVSTK